MNSAKPALSGSTLRKIHSGFFFYADTTGKIAAVGSKAFLKNTIFKYNAESATLPKIHSACKWKHT